MLNRNESNSFNSSFNTMRNIVISFIALTFIAMIVILVMFFTGNLNMSYSYNYQVGNVTYSENFNQ